MATLKRTAISANPYEEFKNVYGKTEAYGALGGDTAYKDALNRDATAESANAFIGTVMELQNRGGVDAFKAEYNTQYLTDYEKLLAAENELFGDRETLNTYTRYQTDDDGNYVFDDDGNYIEEEYEDTSYNYVKEYLASSAQTGIEKEQYAIEELERKNENAWQKIGRGLASIFATVVEIGTKAVDTFIGGFDFIYQLSKALGTQDWDAFRNYNYDYLSHLMEDFDRNYTYFYDAHGNLTTFGQMMQGVSNTIGAMLPTMGMQGIASCVGKAAGTSANAMKVASKVIGLTYWYNLGYTGSADHMKSSPSAPVWACLVAGFGTAAIQAGVTYMMSKTIGLNKLNAYTLGVDETVAQLTTKKIAQGTVKATLTHFLKSFLTEGYRQFVEEEFQEMGQYIVEAATHAICNDFNVVMDINPQQMLNACMMSYITSFITTTTTYTKTLINGRLNTNQILTDKNGNEIKTKLTKPKTIIDVDESGNLITKTITDQYKYKKFTVAQSMDIKNLMMEISTRANNIENRYCKEIKRQGKTGELTVETPGIGEGGKSLTDANVRLNPDSAQSLRLKAEITNLVNAVNVLAQFFGAMTSDGKYTDKNLQDSIELVSNFAEYTKVHEVTSRVGGYDAYIQMAIVNRIIADYHKADTTYNKAFKRSASRAGLGEPVKMKNTITGEDLSDTFNAIDEALSTVENEVEQEYDEASVNDETDIDVEEPIKYVDEQELAECRAKHSKAEARLNAANEAAKGLTALKRKSTTYKNKANGANVELSKLKSDSDIKKSLDGAKQEYNTANKNYNNAVNNGAADSTIESLKTICDIKHKTYVDVNQMYTNKCAELERTRDTNLGAAESIDVDITNIQNERTEAQKEFDELDARLKELEALPHVPGYEKVAGNIALQLEYDAACEHQRNLLKEHDRLTRERDAAGKRYDSAVKAHDAAIGRLNAAKKLSDQSKIGVYQTAEINTNNREVKAKGTYDSLVKQVNDIEKQLRENDKQCNILAAKLKTSSDVDKAAAEAISTQSDAQIAQQNEATATSEAAEAERAAEEAEEKAKELKDKAETRKRAKKNKVKTKTEEQQLSNTDETLENTTETPTETPLQTKAEEDAAIESAEVTETVEPVETITEPVAEAEPEVSEETPVEAPAETAEEIVADAIEEGEDSEAVYDAQVKAAEEAAERLRKQAEEAEAKRKEEARKRAEAEQKAREAAEKLAQEQEAARKAEEERQAKEAEEAARRAEEERIAAEEATKRAEEERIAAEEAAAERAKEEGAAAGPTEEVETPVEETETSVENNEVEEVKNVEPVKNIGAALNRKYADIRQARAHGATEEELAQMYKEVDEMRFDAALGQQLGVERIIITKSGVAPVVARIDGLVGMPSRTMSTTEAIVTGKTETTNCAFIPQTIYEDMVARGKNYVDSSRKAAKDVFQYAVIEDIADSVNPHIMAMVDHAVDLYCKTYGAEYAADEPAGRSPKGKNAKVNRVNIVANIIYNDAFYQEMLRESTADVVETLINIAKIYEASAKFVKESGRAKSPSEEWYITNVNEIRDRLKDGLKTYLIENEMLSNAELLQMRGIFNADEIRDIRRQRYGKDIRDRFVNNIFTVYDEKGQIRDDIKDSEGNVIFSPKAAVEVLMKRIDQLPLSEQERDWCVRNLGPSKEEIKNGTATKGGIDSRSRVFTQLNIHYDNMFNSRYNYRAGDISMTEANLFKKGGIAENIANTWLIEQNMTIGDILYVYTNWDTAILAVDTALSSNNTREDLQAFSDIRDQLAEYYSKDASDVTAEDFKNFICESFENANGHQYRFVITQSGKYADMSVEAVTEITGEYHSVINNSDMIGSRYNQSYDIRGYNSGNNTYRNDLNAVFESDIRGTGYSKDVYGYNEGYVYMMSGDAVDWTAPIKQKGKTLETLIYGERSGDQFFEGIIREDVYDVMERTGVNISINDILAHPDWLTDNIRNAIAKNYGDIVNTGTAYRFLNYYILTATGGMDAINVTQDGKFVLTDMREIYNNEDVSRRDSFKVVGNSFYGLFPLDAFTSGDTKLQESYVSDLVKSHPEAFYQGDYIEDDVESLKHAKEIGRDKYYEMSYEERRDLAHTWFKNHQKLEYKISEVLDLSLVGASTRWGAHNGVIKENVNPFEGTPLNDVVVKPISELRKYPRYENATTCFIDGVIYYDASNTSEANWDPRLDGMINYYKLWHEFTHAVQKYNGFAGGASTDVLRMMDVETQNAYIQSLYHHVPELWGVSAEYAERNDLVIGEKDVRENNIRIAENYLYITTAGEVAARGMIADVRVWGRAEDDITASINGAKHGQVPKGTNYYVDKCRMLPTLICDAKDGTYSVMTAWGEKFDFKTTGGYRQSIAIPFKDKNGNELKVEDSNGIIRADIKTEKGINFLNTTLNQGFLAMNGVEVQYTEQEQVDAENLTEKYMGEDPINRYKDAHANHYVTSEAVRSMKRNLLDFLNTEEGQKARTRSLEAMHQVYAPNISYEAFLEQDIAVTRIQSNDHIIDDGTFVDTMAGNDTEVKWQIGTYFQQYDRFNDRTAHLFTSNIKVKDILYYYGDSELTALVMTDKFMKDYSNLTVAFQIGEMNMFGGADIDVYAVEKDGSYRDTIQIPVKNGAERTQLQIDRFNTDVTVRYTVDDRAIPDNSILVIQQPEPFVNPSYFVMSLDGVILIDRNMFEGGKAYLEYNPEHNSKNLIYYNTYDGLYRSDVDVIDSMTGRTSNDFAMEIVPDSKTGLYTPRCKINDAVNPDYYIQSTRNYTERGWTSNYRFVEHDIFELENGAIGATSRLTLNFNRLIGSDDRTNNYIRSLSINELFTARNYLIDLLTSTENTAGTTTSMKAIVTAIMRVDSMLSRYSEVFEPNVSDAITTATLKNGEWSTVTDNPYTGALNMFTEVNYYDKTINDKGEILRDEIAGIKNQVFANKTLDTIECIILKYLLDTRSVSYESEFRPSVDINDISNDRLNAHVKNFLCGHDENGIALFDMYTNDRNTYNKVVKSVYDTCCNNDYLKLIMERFNPKLVIDAYIDAITKFIRLNVRTVDYVFDSDMLASNHTLQLDAIELIDIPLTEEMAKSEDYDHSFEKYKLSAERNNNNYILREIAEVVEQYFMANVANMDESLVGAASTFEAMKYINNAVVKEYGEFDKHSSGDDYVNYLTIDGVRRMYVAAGFPTLYEFIASTSENTKVIYHNNAEMFNVKSTIYNAVTSTFIDSIDAVRLNDYLMSSDIDVDSAYSNMVTELELLQRLMKHVNFNFQEVYKHIDILEDELKDMIRTSDDREARKIEREEGSDVIKMSWNVSRGKKDEFTAALKQASENSNFVAKIPNTSDGKDHYFVAKNRVVNKGKAAGTNLQYVVDKAGHGDPIQMDQALQCMIVETDMNRASGDFRTAIMDAKFLTLHDVTDFAKHMDLVAEESKAQEQLNYTYNRIAGMYAARREDAIQGFNPKTGYLGNVATADVASMLITGVIPDSILKKAGVESYDYDKYGREPYLYKASALARVLTAPVSEGGFGRPLNYIRTQRIGIRNGVTNIDAAVETMKNKNPASYRLYRWFLEMSDKFGRFEISPEGNVMGDYIPLGYEQGDFIIKLMKRYDGSLESCMRIITEVRDDKLALEGIIFNKKNSTQSLETVTSTSKDDGEQTTLEGKLADQGEFAYSGGMMSSWEEERFNRASYPRLYSVRDDDVDAYNKIITYTMDAYPDKVKKAISDDTGEDVTNVNIHQPRYMTYVIDIAGQLCEDYGLDGVYSRIERWENNPNYTFKRVEQTDKFPGRTSLRKNIKTLANDIWDITSPKERRDITESFKRANDITDPNFKLFTDDGNINPYLYQGKSYDQVLKLREQLRNIRDGIKTGEDYSREVEALNNQIKKAKNREEVVQARYDRQKDRLDSARDKLKAKDKYITRLKSKKKSVNIEVSHAVAMPKALQRILNIAVEDTPVRASKVNATDGSEVKYATRTISSFVKANEQNFANMSYQDWIDVAEFLADSTTVVINSTDTDGGATYVMYTIYLLEWMMKKYQNGALLFDADLYDRIIAAYDRYKRFSGGVMGAISAAENYLNPERIFITQMVKRYGIEYTEEEIDDLTFILSRSSTETLKYIDKNEYTNTKEVIDENGKKRTIMIDYEGREIIPNDKNSTKLLHPDMYDSAVSLRELINHFGREEVLNQLLNQLSPEQREKFNSELYAKAEKVFESQRLESNSVAGKRRNKLDTTLSQYTEEQIKKGLYPEESPVGIIKTMMEHGSTFDEAVDTLKNANYYKYTELSESEKVKRINEIEQEILSDDAIFNWFKSTDLVYESKLNNIPGMDRPVQMVIMTGKMKRNLTFHATEQIRKTALEHVNSMEGKQDLRQRLVAFEQACMLSSPGTWLRNIMSNVGLRTINTVGTQVERLLEKACPPLAKQIRNKSAIVQDRMKGGKINLAVDEITNAGYRTAADIKRVFDEHELTYTDEDIAKYVFIQNIFPVRGTKSYTDKLLDSNIVEENRKLIHDNNQRNTYDKIKAIEEREFRRRKAENHGRGEGIDVFNIDDAILKGRTCIVSLNELEKAGFELDDVLTDSQAENASLKYIAVSHKQLNELRDQVIHGLIEQNDGEYRAGIKHAILYQIVGTKVTNDMKTAVDNLLDSPIYTDDDGVNYNLWDTVNAGLTRYADDMKRSSTDKPTGNKYAMMIIDKFSREIVDAHKFDSKRDNKAAVAAGKALNMVTGWMYRMMTDNPFIKKRATYYFTRMLTELEIAPQDVSITNGEVLDVYADAYVEAAWEYMHKGNFMREAERDILNRWGENAWFIFKQLFPFGNASMNWAIAALECSPYGLIKGIYQLVHLDKTYEKNLARSEKFAGEPSANFTLYQARQVAGRGIIGTFLMALGAAMAGLGIFRIDKEDNELKLYLGDNIYLDVSDVFGTSSFLAGAGLMYALADTDNETFGEKLKAGMTATLDAIMKDNIIASFIESSKYSETFADYLYYTTISTLNNFLPAAGKALNQVILSIPAGKYGGDIQYASGLLGQIERFTVNIPIAGIFIGAFGYGFQQDIFTGENKSTYKMQWLVTAINKFTPINVDAYSYSPLEQMCIDLGLNKTQLTGKYEDIGKLSQQQVKLLNQMYGKLNNQDLTAFFNNRTAYTVQDEHGNYVTLKYNKMTDAQRANVVDRIMTNNAKYAKVYVWTKIMGGKYYATQSEFTELKNLGIRTKVYLETSKYSGFLK